MTLTEFLLARIEDDEDAAREFVQYEDDVYETAGWLSPTRVLAECEAKRRIIEEFVKHDQRNSLEEQAWRAWSLILRTLAKVHSDHPDYDPAWDPS